jgi:LysM repeat protein
MKKGVKLTFGGQNAQSVNVPSKIEITAVTPPGTAGQEVAIVLTNNGKPDMPVTLGQKFRYTDATPPTVTGINPADGTIIADYEDSLNVGVPISITFSEDVNSGSGSVSVSVNSTPNSVSQQSGPISGSVGGSGNMITFTPSDPLRSGRKYTVNVEGVKDTSAAGNMLASAKSFSFTVSSPETCNRYRVRKGDTLPIIASRPEVYDNAKLWPRLVEANQDDYRFDRDRITEGQWLWVPRGEAWGDVVASTDD